MSRLTVLFWGFVLLVATTTVQAYESKRKDLDGDGIREAVVFYDGRTAVRAVSDVNQDGHPDMFIYYRDGVRDHADVDIDEDGRADKWIYYGQDGVPWKEAYDFDKNGRADYWVFYRSGQVSKWEQDRNDDGKPDVRTFYESSGKAIEKPLFRQSFDNDYDGEYESVSGLSVLRPEVNIPHSLAEALLR